MPLRMIVTVCAMFLLGAVSNAAVPTSITVQGKLTDAQGLPLAAGFKLLTFRIFDAQAAGLKVWPEGDGEPQAVTSNSEGVWSASVGTLQPLSDSVFSSSIRWLEVHVNDGVNPPITMPRIRLQTGPYTYRVATVDGAAGGAISGNVNVSGRVGIGTTSPQSKLHVREGLGSGASPFANSIATFEGDASTECFISVLSPNNARRGILFGQPSNSVHGSIMYNTVTVPYGFEFRTGDNVFALALDSTGKVGVGVSGAALGNAITLPNIVNPSGRALAQAWATYSSRRWKNNIRTIEGALDKVQRLRGVTYDSKDGGVHCVGLIAEEVGEVLPEVVQYEENGVDAQSMDYARLTALLIEAVKEQQKHIEALEKKLEQSIP